jgi:hypothetical protein
LIDIRLATEPHERRAVYELRYKVIVEEQNGTADPAIDYGNRTLVENADETAMHFIAEEDGIIVGAVRSNLIRHGFAEPFSSLLGHHLLSD